MQRLSIILGAVLAGQLALAGVLHFGGADTARGGPSERPLAAFDRDAVDSVQIDGANKEQLRLVRGDDGWRLPASDGFPVTERSIERLLGDLEGFEQRLPVARSESARERFKVGSENFERRVRLMDGGEAVATIFFGSSAGTGRVYARAQGRDMIHEVRFALWHAATDPSKWRDTSLVEVDPASVEQARLPGFLVRRADDGTGWQLLADGRALETADAGAAAKLIRRLAKPGVQGVSKAEPPQGEPTLTYTLTTKEGEEVRFRYYAVGDGPAQLYRGDQPWRYTVADKRLAKIEQATPKTLLAGKGGDSAASAGADGATGGAS